MHRNGVFHQKQAECAFMCADLHYVYNYTYKAFVWY